MLTRDDNLVFLENKIKEIKMASFVAEMDIARHLPNNIISTIKTDGDGNIWFFTSCKAEHSKKIDNCFFAHLEYYQKEQDCRLRLSGKASITEGDDKTCNSPIETISTVNTGIVLIKFKILYAEYIENEQPGIISVKEKVKTFLTHIFIQHSDRLHDS